MKKIFAVALVAMMTLTANAQWYVGGGIGVQHTKNDSDKKTSFKILPEVGYNINDSWAVGTTIGYAYSKHSFDEGGSYKTNSFTFSPYLRYTFVKWEKVNVFCDLGLNYEYEKADEMKTNSFGIGLYPGLAINLNQKLSFVTKIGALSYLHSKVTDGPKSDDFNFGVDGSPLTFAVYYNF